MAEKTDGTVSVPFTEWSVLELMGHVRLAGRVSEQELFGTKVGRIDVPAPDGTGFVTQFFGGASVYRLTPVSEEVAREVAKRNQPEPVGRWDVKALLPPEPPLRSRRHDDRDMDAGEAFAAAYMRPDGDEDDDEDGESS